MSLHTQVVCYCEGMSKPTKEKACVNVRLFPSTHKSLKILAAKKGMSFAEVVSFLVKEV